MMLKIHTPDSHLSTIQSCDIIIFVGENGTIDEMGTWDELCNKKDGKFAAFVKVRDSINISVSLCSLCLSLSLSLAPSLSLFLLNMSPPLHFLFARSFKIKTILKDPIPRHKRFFLLRWGDRRRGGRGRRRRRGERGGGGRRRGGGACTSLQ